MGEQSEVTSSAGPSSDALPFHLTAVDRWVLSQTDEEFVLHSWEGLKEIIAQNRLQTLKRLPSHLRAYLAWSTDIRNRYGSMVNYVMRERLRWEPLPAPSITPDSNSTAQEPLFACRNPTPFADRADYKVLPNDWPYGMEPGIVHLLVWLKPRLAVAPETGDLTAEARALVERFVGETFVERLRRYEREAGGAGRGEDGSGKVPAEERVLWFKNWGKLQSVRGIDHVHVLVRDAPTELIKDWTRDA